MAQMQLKMAFLGCGKIRSAMLIRGAGAVRAGSSSSEQGSGPSDGGSSADPASYQSRVVQFSSSRSREYMSVAAQVRHEDDDYNSGSASGSSHGQQQQQPEMDEHVGSYDATGSVSLNSAMQTMVPEPFEATGRKSSPSHFNMPGGHVMQGHKYLSDERQKNHYGQLQGVSGTNDGAKQFSTLAVHHSAVA